MTDPRFFSNHGPFPVAHLRALAECTLKVVDGGRLVDAGENILARSVHDVAPLDRAGEHEISFLDNPKYADSFRASQAGFCLIRPKQAETAPEGMVLFVTPDPYRAYALVAQAFYPRPASDARISPRAEIAPTASIGEGTQIDAFAVIGPEAQIGAHCVIGAGAHIAAGVVIGAGSHIGANSTLSHCILGARVIIHRGAHLGQDGFGFASSRAGHIKVPQLGRVVIEDDVEIGSGTCIDRGTGPDTVIGQGSKIDNLVQIGHNVTMGRLCVIVSQVGISGSTKLGDGVALGGQVGLAGHLRIGSGAKLAASSGLMHDVPPGAIYGGTPALPIKEWHRQTLALQRISKRDTKDEA